ncbi:MAG: SDR family NAD(P)-dependent oxidoreductase [Rhodoblastus sp.]|jgi:NAD(P)-dependent dehydrogenase (short-subunit alcohol dehydrogenase family)
MTRPGIRTVVVTGGASGIGYAIVGQLLKAGARVGLVDIDPRCETVASAFGESGGRVHAARADITKVEEVAAAVSSIETAFGPIDGLVNNAGIVDNIAPLEKMAQSAWERELAVNLTGPFNMIRAVIGGMRERRYGRIVNISSAAARGGLVHQSGYAASKAGLLGLTRNVTLEYARYGITCNAVLPGMTATEKVRAMPEPIRAAAQTMTPAGRFGSVDEIAHLVVFLLGPDSGFINGAEIDITGGAHLNVMTLGSRKELSERAGAR